MHRCVKGYWANILIMFLFLGLSERVLALQTDAHRDKHHVCALQCLFDGGLAFIGSSLQCILCV